MGIIESIFQTLSHGRQMFKGGDFSQVGGEFLFEDGQVTWCHRMKNTRDHAEVPALRKQLGLDDQQPPRRKRWSSLGVTDLGRRLSNRRSRSWSRKRNSMAGSAMDRKSSSEGSVMDKVKEDKVEEAAAARE